MIQRYLSEKLIELAGWFPIVSLTGPRQSGKSTLVQAAFPRYEYINLEDPRVFQRASADPSGFIATLPKQTILDEAQRVPELFSALQVAADKTGTPGQYVLSGSQNYLLLKSIQQSLAGRVGIAYLMPLSHREISQVRPEMNPFELIVRGAYPALHATSVPTHLFFENYIDTYIARDAFDYLGVRNEIAFRKFLIACAARAGNLVNYADLARDVDVNVHTVKSWLSVLSTCHIVRLLPAYAANISKRLIKAPKLYFCDTGLLCYLLGIESSLQLQTSDYLGPVFENFIISEQEKMRFNALERPNMYFYRDDSKIEVDLIDASEVQKPIVCEIKSGQTFRKSFTRNVRTVVDTLKLPYVYPAVVYGGEGVFKSDGVNVFGIQEWLSSSAVLNL